MLKAMALISCIFLLFPFSVRAQETKSGEPQHVHLSFVPESQTILPGKSFRVAVIQTIDPHWHTYWRNPGDSGTAMKISWTLPPGFRAEAMEWPVPERVPAGPLVNFGYSGKAVFLQNFTAPKALPSGPLTFTADVELLVCRDICIPEISRHSFTIGGEGGAVADAALFAQAAKDQPARIPVQARYHEQGGDLVLHLESADSSVMNALRMGSADLFPEEWGVIDNPEKTRVTSDKNTITLLHRRGIRSLDEISVLRAVIAFPDGGGGRRGIEIEASADPDAAAGHGDSGEKPVGPEGEGKRDASLSSSSSEALSSVTGQGGGGLGGESGAGSARGAGFLTALFFAFLGGIILNLMPCVFPILSIKALGLVQLAHKHPERARAHGVAYAGGVVISFLAVAGMLIALRAAGAAVGWGFQLQNPLVVTALSFLLFGIGLNLLGMFEVSIRLPRALHKHVSGDRQGLSGSFLTGVLATLVATPCTAPFMGVAVGYAAVHSAPVSLGVFAVLGLGLAVPFGGFVVLRSNP